MQIQSLGQEDFLQKEMATHFSTLAWEIPWTEEPGRPESMVHKELHKNVHTPIYTKNTVCVYQIYTEFSEKAMAPHSSTLTWKIPWTEEPGGLQSMGSLRVGHD